MPLPAQQGPFLRYSTLLRGRPHPHPCFFRLPPETGFSPWAGVCRRTPAQGTRYSVFRPSLLFKIEQRQGGILPVHHRPQSGSPDGAGGGIFSKPEEPHGKAGCLYESAEGPKKSQFCFRGAFVMTGRLRSMRFYFQ